MFTVEIAVPEVRCNVQSTWRWHNIDGSFKRALLQSALTKISRAPSPRAMVGVAHDRLELVGFELPSVLLAGISGSA